MIETHTFENGVQVIVTENAMRIETGAALDLSHPQFNVNSGDFYQAIEFALTPRKAIYESYEDEEQFATEGEIKSLIADDMGEYK
jgi:hypothetical protein